MKNFNKKIVVLGCMGVVFAGLIGCNANEENKEKILTVITDPSIQKEVKNVADYMMKTEDIKININVLPQKKDGRDSEIQKIQTQIMSGKGADIYLLDTDSDASDMKTELFANPYQIMQSGVLAPLNEYMEEDSYWDDTSYNMNILSAGQFKEKQYIIPLSCNYYVLSGANNIENITGNTLIEWLNQVKTLNDSKLTATFIESLYLTSGRWFQPAANYETHQVLFDKEKWKEFSEAYFSLEQETNSEEDNIENQYQIQPVDSYSGSEETYMKVIPDLEGRKMASVMTYGAVGMSSNHKEEAYDFIMLFLNDQIQKNGNGYMAPTLSGSAGITVEQNEIRNWMSERSAATISAIEKSFEELDGAYFITDAEKNIISQIRKAAEWGVEPENGWNKYLSDVAENAWRQYEMQVKE